MQLIGHPDFQKALPPKTATFLWRYPKHLWKHRYSDKWVNKWSKDIMGDNIVQPCPTTGITQTISFCKPEVTKLHWFILPLAFTTWHRKSQPRTVVFDSKKWSLQKTGELWPTDRQQRTMRKQYSTAEKPSKASIVDNSWQLLRYWTSFGMQVL